MEPTSTAEEVPRYLLQGGGNPDYLAARIKRDAPDIAARIDEFPSIRAAAIEAGIVHPPSPLAIVQIDVRKKIV
jgi:hypothetical protein